MTVPARSVFAEPLARAREALDRLAADGHCTCGRVYTCDWCVEQDAHAALDLIEQRATDMESALREARDWIAEEYEVLNAADADWRGRLLNRLDAVLSAREEAQT